MMNEQMYTLLIQDRPYSIGSIGRITAEALTWSKVFTHIRIEPAS